MKLFHLSDLHLGRRLNECPLLDDQKYILDQVLELCRAQRPDALLLAGDIYDKAVPPAEAVQLFDSFLTGLAGLDLPVLLVSGNHDSPERLSFGARIFSRQNIHMAGVFEGGPLRVELRDRRGPVDFWLLPFVRPAAVRAFCPGRSIQTTHEAVAAALEHCPADPARRNVLVAHQFVTAGAAQPVLSESETPQVGGLDAVDAGLFDAFDYVALGHLHGAQHMGRDQVRYAGSPLKYSFSEVNQHKSMTVVQLEEKGGAEVSTLPLRPLHGMREVQGTLRQLLDLQTVAQGDPADYLRVTLTDPDDQPAAAEQLRAVYPNLMRLDYLRDLAELGALPEFDGAVARPPEELFAEFYEKMQDRPLDDEKLELVRNCLNTARGGDPA